MIDERCNLLVIDTSPADRARLGAILEAEGCSVALADSTAGAYELFLRSPFDGILAELATAEARGWALLDRFREIAPEVPYIALAPDTAPGLLLQALQRGAFAALPQPGTPEELHRVLTQARLIRRRNRDWKNTLETARSNQKFSEDVLRGVSEGILVFDAKGRMRFQNREAMRILGDEVSAQGDEDAALSGLHKSLVSQVLQLLASTLTEGREERKMLVIEGEDRRIHLEVTTSRLRASDGKTQGAIALLRDKSTERLLEEQLVHSERLATLGGLLASIAHDINNPLTCVTGCAEIGLETAGELEAEAARLGPDGSNLGRLAAEVRDLFDQVQEAGLRCGSIANNLLAYSRRSPMQVQRVDINDLLEKTVEFVARYRKIATVEVVRHLDRNLPRIAVDGSQLQQAFTNLIDNAVQAMEDCPTKRLELVSQSSDGNVIIEISDTGPGIPERRLEKIWEPFFTTKKSGTGLGLYITRRVIENQKGLISVSSKVGTGTRFRIVLPLV